MERRRSRRRRARPNRRWSKRLPRVLLGAGLAGAVAFAWLTLGTEEPALPELPTDPRELERFRQGESLYATHCARCHGERLKGEPDWRRRRPDGSYPAPPHDRTGHTWHHSDAQLMDMILSAGQPRAARGIPSRMPAFRELLSGEEVVAILWFIERHWSPDQRAHQEEVTRRTLER